MDKRDVTLLPSAFVLPPSLVAIKSLKFNTATLTPMHDPKEVLIKSCHLVKFERFFLLHDERGGKQGRDLAPERIRLAS